MGRAVSRRGAGRDDRPVLGPAPPAREDPGTGCAEDRASALEAAPGPDPDRRTTADAGLDGARGPGPCRLNRLTHIDRVTGEPARRYERSRPGELIHVDVTKFGNIPDGGGWRFVGKPQGDQHRQATRDRTGIKARKYHPKVGTCFMHT